MHLREQPIHKATNVIRSYLIQKWQRDKVLGVTQEGALQRLQEMYHHNIEGVQALNRLNRCLIANSVAKGKVWDRDAARATAHQAHKVHQ